MYMLKLQCLTVKLGKTARNDLSSIHVPDKATLSVLHSQIMVQVWFDNPCCMPAFKAWVVILRLATSSEGIDTGMFLADLKALIDTSSAPDGITTHELDARAEGVLMVCDQFTSVSALRDFIRSCLRAEAIKSVAARGDRIGFAHGQANYFLITKRLEGSGLSLKDTQYAKTEQKEHIAMLLSFYETHKDNDDRGRKSGRGDGCRGRGGGRGGKGSGDGAAIKQTPGPPTTGANNAAMSGNTKKLR